MSNKSMIAKYGHIKRKLAKDEPLKGKTLTTALEVVDENLNEKSADSAFWSTIKEKLLSGKTLDDYEYHVFVEVVLLHKRLAE